MILLYAKHQGKNSNQLTSPAGLHVSMKTLKSYISEVYKVQGDCLKDSGSDSYDKNDTKKKVNDLVRLHEAMQQKLIAASYSEQIQILTLIPNKWSQINCLEYFNVFESLVEITWYQTCR